MMQNLLSRAGWIHRFIILGTVFPLFGCLNVNLTKPLCGPESFDQRPYSVLPDAFVGCYENPSMAMGTNMSTNMFTAKENAKTYSWIDKNSAGQTAVFISQPLSQNLRNKLLRDAVNRESLMLCDVPGKYANPNARLMMVYENGWYHFVEHSYDTERRALVVSSYEPSITNLKKSGLRYVVFPKMNEDSYPTGNYPKDNIFSADIGMILIDNAQISPEALFEQLQYTRSSFHYEFLRVDNSFCSQQAKHKIL